MEGNWVALSPREPANLLRALCARLLDDEEREGQRRGESCTCSVLLQRGEDSVHPFSQKRWMFTRWVIIAWENANYY